MAKAHDQASTTTAWQPPPPAGVDPSPHLHAIAKAYRSAITPRSFVYWCDQLCLDEAEVMKRHVRALLQEEDERRAAAEDEEFVSAAEASAILARVKQALPETMHRDLARMLDHYIADGLNQADVFFRIGMTIGGAR